MKDNIVIIVRYNIDFTLQENITCGLTLDQVSVFLLMLADDSVFVSKTAEDKNKGHYIAQKIIIYMTQDYKLIYIWAQCIFVITVISVFVFCTVGFLIVACNR